MFVCSNRKLVIFTSLQEKFSALVSTIPWVRNGILDCSPEVPSGAVSKSSKSNSYSHILLFNADS